MNKYILWTMLVALFSYTATGREPCLEGECFIYTALRPMPYCVPCISSTNSTNNNNTNPVVASSP